MRSTSWKNRSLLPALLLTLSLLPFVFQSVRFYHYTNDDAYITYRYSRNLVLGRGPYFNAGEHVEGYTNFLQMLQTALVIRLAGPAAAPGIAKFLGVLYGAGCVALTFLLFAALFPEKPRGLPRHLTLAGALAAAAMVGISPSVAVNSTSGLETSMFTFFLVLGMRLGVCELQRGRWCGSGLAFAALVLTRPEGSLLFAVFWVACAAAAGGSLLSSGNAADPGAAPRRIVLTGQARLLILNGCLVTGVFLAHLAFRYLAYDGELLPNTYYAKRGGFWNLSSWSYTSNGLLAPVLGFGGFAGALTGFAAGFRRLPRPLICIGAVAVAGGLSPFLLGTDWMVGYRLLVPYIPAAAVAVAGGWVLLLSRFDRVGPRSAAAFVGGIALLLWFTQDAAREKILDETLVRARGYDTGHRAAVGWLRSQAGPGDGIALMDTGIIGYDCIDQTILDITGLTDRHIAKSQGTFMDKNYDPAYVLDRRPRFIVLTLYAPGRSYAVPKPGTRFQPWSDMEARLIENPGFRRFYVRRRPPPASPPADWLDSYAARLGAERVFEHGNPRLQYLLAVFSHRDAPAASEGAGAGDAGSASYGGR